MVFLLGVSLLVLVGGLAIAAILGVPSLVDRLLAVCVGSLALVTGCLLVAGSAHVLRPWPVVGLYAAASTALVVSAGPRRLWSWVGTLTRDAAGAVGCLPRTLRRRPWLAILVVLVVGEATWHAVLAFLLPLTGSDALHYHLTTTAWWLQSGSFAANPFTPESRGYPSGTELIFSHVALFARDVSFVDLTQLAFAAIGALASAGIARLLGARRAAAAAAGLIFFSTPIVLTQMAVPYVDVACAAELAACLYFTGRMLRAVTDPAGGARSHAVLAGCAAGLCLGSKPSAPIWVGVVVLAVAANLLWFRRRRTGGSRPFALLGALLVPTVALGSYWYLRNAIVYHDPLYPATLSFAGTTLFHGAPGVDNLIDSPPGTPLPFPLSIARSWAHDLAPFLTGERFYRYDQRSGGLGPTWVYVVLPLIAVALWRGRRNLDRVPLTIGGVALVAWLISPYTWWSRFSLILVSVGAAVAATQLDRLRGARTRATVLGALVLTTVVGAAMADWQYQIGDGRSVTAVTVLRLADRSELAQAMDVGGATLAARVPADATIAVDAENITYFAPIWGDRFQHRLVPIRLSTAHLADELARAGVQYVFTGSSGAARDALAAGAAEVGRDSRFRLFRVTGA